MEILEGHHQQWTAQLAGLSGDFRAANTGNLGDARQQLIAPGVVTRQCHYLSVLFYPFRELTPETRDGAIPGAGGEAQGVFERVRAARSQ